MVRRACILIQSPADRFSRLKDINIDYPTALRGVQITPKTSINIRRYFTPEDRLDSVSRKAQATDWIEVTKKILFVKANFFSTFYLHRNLKVKNSNVSFGRSKDDFSRREK